MHRVQSEAIPRLFLSKFHKPQHKYSKNFDVIVTKGLGNKTFFRKLLADSYEIEYYFFL